MLLDMLDGNLTSCGLNLNFVWANSNFTLITGIHSVSVTPFMGGVSASVHAGVHPPGQTPLGQTPLPWADTPPGQTPRRRYASYWNAFLFNLTCVKLNFAQVKSNL